MKLLEFPHSHYCEKARWALDYKQMVYQRVAILPGFHIKTVRRYAPKTLVPVLLTESQAVQGSSEIIDYLDHHYPLLPLTPEGKKEHDYCRHLEKAMSYKLGEPIRTILYDKLLAYPGFIRFCFTHTLPPFKQFVFRLYYPLLKRKIYQVYVVSDERVHEARSIFEKTMDELEKEISSKQYLVGGTFTRADLSLSSMLSVLVLPPQFPMNWPKIPNPCIQALHDQFQDHPVWIWVQLMYQKHRQPLVN